MPAIPTRLSAFLTEANDCPINPPTYVSARVLAAGVAESISVPANGSFVLLSGTADFYISYTNAAAPVVATVPVDDDTGASCELIKANGAPVWRWIPGTVDRLSVISAGVCIVTAAFFSV